MKIEVNIKASGDLLGVFCSLADHIRVNWETVPEQVKWVAVDGNGDVYGFTHEPVVISSEMVWNTPDGALGPWWGRGDNTLVALGNIEIPLGIDWRLLKFRRPGEGGDGDGSPVSG